MRRMMALKLVCLSALAIATLASSHLAFDVTAIDQQGEDRSAAKRSSNKESSHKATLADVALAETHTRPIFSQNRRPFVPQPPIVEQPMTVVEQSVSEQSSRLPRRLVLLGTNIGGAASSVLVRNQENEEVRWLTVGETFDGWVLADTSGDQAAFVCQQQKGDDCDYRLMLYSETGRE